MKKYIAIVLILFGQLALFGQNPCEIYFETKNATANSIEVDVKANDFSEVIGFQMYTTWDSTVLEYNSIVFTHADLNVLFNYGGFLKAGVLSSNWFYSGDPQSYSDGVVLYTIKFDLIGEPCDSTTMKLVDNDVNRKSYIYYDTNDDEHPVKYIPTGVKIPGDNCETGDPSCTGLILTVEEVLAGEGADICIAIKVDSFVNIQALQFSIGWDTDVIEWVQEKNSWAKSKGASALHSTPGDSLYYYLMSHYAPLTLGDDSVLVELCFKVVGNNGDFSLVEFVDSLVFEVTDASSNSDIPFCLDDGSVTIGDIDNAVTFIVSDEKADKNSKVCVDVTAKNFNEIESFQYVMEWDADIMTFDKLGTVNNVGIVYNSNGIGGHIKKDGNDRLVFSWDGIPGKTIADDDVLFQLCYDVIGDCNESSNIDILGTTSVPIEVTSGGVILPHVEFSGQVTIECTIDADISVEDVTCNGYSDGSINVTLASGSTYSFRWTKNNVAQSIWDDKQTLNGIGAGVWTVTITDVNSGSSIEKTVTVIQPNPLSMSTPVVLPETCSQKGSISFTVSGETAPYTYVWNPSSLGNTNNPIDLDAGDYSVTFTDSRGCSSITKAFTVASEVTPLVVVESDFKDVSCFGDSDGSASISISGGCPNYSILWSDGDTNAARTGLSAGNLSVTVTDAKGQTVTLPFTFTNPESPLAITDDYIEENPELIDITVEGGAPTYTYSWSGPNDFSADTEDISGDLEAGNYFVTVTDGRGCSVVGGPYVITGVIYPISVEVFVDLIINNGSGVACNGDCNGSITANIIANVGYEVYLDDVKILLPYNQVCGGEHVLKIVDGVLLEEIQVTFNMPEPDAMEIVVDEFTCSNDSKDDGTISVTVTGGTEDYTYVWGENIDGDDFVEDLPQGTYAVVVTDANGCNVLSEDVEVDNCDKSDCYKGSLIMSPNGDEFNEFFLIKCVDDFTSNELFVYNRIGNIVYSQVNYDGTWNGLDLNNIELLQDSYMWVFIGVRENGDKEIFKGTVSLLR